MYEYLAQKFGNVKVLSNGLLYAKDSSGNEIYVRPDCTSTDLFAYYPGRGGPADDAQAIRTQMRSDNPPDYAVIIASKATTQTNILQVATNVMTDNNVSVNNIAVQTFSLSGGIGFDRVGTFIKNNPQYSDRCIMFVADGFNVGEYSKKDSSMTLAEAGVPVVVMDTVSGNRNVATNLARAGYNTYLLELPLSKGKYFSWHQYINSDPVASGLPQYALGLIEGLNGKNSENYSLYKWEDGGFDDASFSELVLLSNSEDNFQNLEVSQVIPTAYIPSLDNYANMPSVYVSDLVHYTTPAELFKDLKYLEHLNINDIPEAFYSDITYILGVVNTLRDYIKNSNFLNNNSAVSFGNPAGIPGCFTAYINEYFNLVGRLMQSLSGETEAIMSVAQLVMDMDENLEDTTPDEESIGSQDNNQESAPIPSEPIIYIDSDDSIPQATTEPIEVSNPVVEEPTIGLTPLSAVTNETNSTEEDNISEEANFEIDGELMKKTSRKLNRAPSRTNTTPSDVTIEDNQVDNKAIKVSTSEPKPIEEPTNSDRRVDVKEEASEPTIETKPIEQESFKEEPVSINDKEHVEMKESEVIVNNSNSSNDSDKSMVQPNRSEVSYGNSQNSTTNNYFTSSNANGNVTINNNTETVETPLVGETIINETPNNNYIDIPTGPNSAIAQEVSNSSTSSKDILKNASIIGALGTGLGTGAYVVKENVDHKGNSDNDYEDNKKEETKDNNV